MVGVGGRWMGFCDNYGGLRLKDLDPLHHGPSNNLSPHIDSIRAVLETDLFLLGYRSCCPCLPQARSLPLLQQSMSTWWLSTIVLLQRLLPIGPGFQVIMRGGTSDLNKEASIRNDYTSNWAVPLLRIYSGYVTVDQLVRSLKYARYVELTFPSLNDAYRHLIGISRAVQHMRTNSITSP